MDEIHIAILLILFVYLPHYGSRIFMLYKRKCKNIKFETIFFLIVSSILGLLIIISYKHPHSEYDTIYSIIIFIPYLVIEPILSKRFLLQKGILSTLAFKDYQNNAVLASLLIIIIEIVLVFFLLLKLAKHF